MHITEKYYNVADFMKEKTHNGIGSKIPPQANFLTAVDHIRDLFDNKKMLYGISGSLHILCLGSSRKMPDVHIVYEDKDYVRIKKYLEADKRVLLPDGMNPLFPFKILVRTGPAYQDLGCREVATIEVNMIPPGSCGTPPSGTLSNNLISVSFKKDGQLKTYKGMNMLYLVQTMLHLCTARDIAWDPRKDLLFLCQNYSSEVHAIRGKLDEKLVQKNFLGTALFSRFSREDQGNCYRVLLGKEPPPTTLITPPSPQCGHGRSVSDSAISRPRLKPHHFTTEISEQLAPELPAPPLPGMSKSVREDSLIVGSEPAEPSTATSISVNPLASKRYSRSRYRSTCTRNGKSKSPEKLQKSTHTQHTVPGKASVNSIPITLQPNSSETSGITLPAQPKVQMVGSKGLCITPQDSGSSSYLTTKSATSSISVAGTFELVATTHRRQNIAELSDEIEATLQLEDHALPETQHSLNELFVDKVKQQHHIRPHLPRIASVPQLELPASLIPGRGTIPHFNIRTAGSAIDHASAHNGAAHTNASRYSRYYSRPSSAPSSQATSPKANPATSTVYKAYQPTPLPLPPPSTQAASEHRHCTPENLGPVDGAQHPFPTWKQNRTGDPQTAHASRNPNTLAQAHQAAPAQHKDGDGANA